MLILKVLVELPYISCKNLAEVVQIRHYLQESFKNLRCQTNLSDSGRSDISCRVIRFLQDFQQVKTFLARSCPNLRGSWWRNYSSVNVQWAEKYVSALRKNTGVNNFCYCYTIRVAQNRVLFSWRRKLLTTFWVICQNLDIRSAWQQQTWITYVERSLKF